MSKFKANIERLCKTEQVCVKQAGEEKKQQPHKTGANVTWLFLEIGTDIHYGYTYV